MQAECAYIQQSITLAQTVQLAGTKQGSQRPPALPLCCGGKNDSKHGSTVGRPLRTAHSCALSKHHGGCNARTSFITSCTRSSCLPSSSQCSQLRLQPLMASSSYDHAQCHPSASNLTAPTGSPDADSCWALSTRRRRAQRGCFQLVPCGSRALRPIVCGPISR